MEDKEKLLNDLVKYIWRNGSINLGRDIYECSPDTAFYSAI